MAGQPEVMVGMLKRRTFPRDPQINNVTALLSPTIPAPNPQNSRIFCGPASRHREHSKNAIPPREVLAENRNLHVTRILIPGSGCLAGQRHGRGAVCTSRIVGKRKNIESFKIRTTVLWPLRFLRELRVLRGKNAIMFLTTHCSDFTM